MFTRLFTATLAFCAVTSFPSVAQPVIPDRQLLPDVQYHNAIPVVRGSNEPRLAARSRFVHNGTSFIPMDSVSFTYPAAGQNPAYAEMLQQRFGTADHSRDRRSLQNFNADGTIAGYLVQRRGPAAGTWINQCRQAFVYDGGRLTADTAWNWDEASASWKPAACTDYIRNAAGQPVRVLTRHWKAATGRLDSAAELRYEFNEAGQVVTCIARYGSGALRLSGRQEISYDETGAPEQVYHQRFDSASASWKPDYGFRFSYGNGGERLTQTNLSWDESSGTWEAGQRYDYQYGPSGLLEAMEYQSKVSGSWRTVDRYEYAYNSAGQRISALHKLAGPASGPVIGESSEKILFHYETLAAGKVAALAEHALRIWPVPAGSELNMDVRAFAGQAYRCTVTDLQGRRLISLSRPANEGGPDRISLESLPAGTYSLMLQSADGRSFAARFSVVR